MLYRIIQKKSKQNFLDNWAIGIFWRFRCHEQVIWRVFDNWPNCVTQADVNALMHLKKKDNFSFLKHHARCYIICKLEREGAL